MPYARPRALAVGFSAASAPDLARNCSCQPAGHGVKTVGTGSSTSRSRVQPMGRGPPTRQVRQRADSSLARLLAHCIQGRKNRALVHTSGEPLPSGVVVVAKLGVLTLGWYSMQPSSGCRHHNRRQWDGHHAAPELLSPLQQSRSSRFRPCLRNRTLAAPADRSSTMSYISPCPAMSRRCARACLLTSPLSTPPFKPLRPYLLPPALIPLVEQIPALFWAYFPHWV